MAKKHLYTTSEYLDALVLHPNRHSYECKGKEFAIFSNAKSADDDAEWVVAYQKREGLKVRKPAVYRIQLKRVT